MTTARSLFISALILAVSPGCLEPQDLPSKVHDLRVLGISTEQPELMAPFCVFDFSQAQNPAVQQALTVFTTPIRYTALIADPAEDGREIEWELWTCASASDRTCSEEGDPRFQLASGVTVGGELVIDGLTPGLAGVDFTRLANGDASGALLFEILQRDPYRGLGGIRVPLNLHLKAGDEEIWALKLMPYSCNFFPQLPDQESGPTMTQNVQPHLPGVTLDGEAWGEEEIRQLSGPGPFKVEPLDFQELQEHYVVPSFELQPVELDESWEVAWFANLGFFSPEESGGADLGGGEEKVRTEWSPGSTATEKDVTFWFVVRDGRGGQSWLTRHAHWKP